MENITDYQRERLERLEAEIDDLEVRWSDERGVAALLAGPLMPWDQIGDPGNIIPMVLEVYGELLGPPDVLEHFQESGLRQDKRTGAFRARAFQHFDEIPIYGANLLVFADEERGVHRIQSGFWREVEVVAGVQFDQRDLQHLLAERLNRDPDAGKFMDSFYESQPDDWAVENFPLAAHPTLYLFHREEGFRPGYDVLAYQPTEWRGVDGRAFSEIGPAQVVLDAESGEVVSSDSTKIGMAFTNTTGDGRSTLKDSSSNYFVRPLNIVRKDGNEYYLLNRLHTPHIRTIDAGGTESGLEAKLTNDNELSEDPDGHWNSTTTSTSAASRAAAQQPEVDIHFYAEQAWHYYQALGWDGFDDGNFGTHCPVALAAHIGMEANAYFSRYTQPIPGTTSNKHFGYLAFYDGLADGTTLKFDFMGGDPVVFAHEWQHAVTYFGAQKTNGEPGYLGTSGYHRSIHEGYSDAFACLRYGLWITPLFYPKGAVHPPASGDGAYTTTYCGKTATNYPRPFRRVEFPRSTNTTRGDWYLDHFDDRNQTQSTQCWGFEYFRSTLFSHLAFLLGQGGVHQRTSRAAAYIPVTSIGAQKTAEIFHYALTNYFDNLPSTSSSTAFTEAANYLLDAAKNIPGGSNRSCEYVMMRRALYALGLYPYDSSLNKQTYGGEACMLPWVYSWRFSQPYLPFAPLWWQSPDLFINNNGSVEYNAKVNQENKLFARVRNIGDQDLSNVKVKFYFSPMGTNLPSSIAGWHACKDKLGNACVLTISTLAAGSVNITNTKSPPASQAVKWFLDPAYVTPAVDHFCLRAVIECEAANHNHDCPNQVQSNVQYEKLPGATFGIRFQVANWDLKPHPLDLEVTHTLPKSYELLEAGDMPQREIVLQPREPQDFAYKIEPPPQPVEELEPPFDGMVNGQIEGEIAGQFEGQLSSVRPSRSVPPVIKVSGMLAGTIDEGTFLTGDFNGELDIRSGRLEGKVRSTVSLKSGRTVAGLDLRLFACLQPVRVVNITQRIDGEAVGGVTVKFKLPRLPLPCS